MTAQSKHPEITDAKPKYPDIRLSSRRMDGNAFCVVAAVSRALRKGGASPDEIEGFCAEALSKDYDQVLLTAVRWIHIGP